MTGLGLVGAPKQVITQIEQLGEAGITHVNLGGPIGPDIPQAIKLLGDQVMPYFRLRVMRSGLRWNRVELVADFRW